MEQDDDFMLRGAGAAAAIGGGECGAATCQAIGGAGICTYSEQERSRDFTSLMFKGEYRMMGVEENANARIAITQLSTTAMRVHVNVAPRRSNKCEIIVLHKAL